MPQIASEARKPIASERAVLLKLDFQPAQNGILHSAKLLRTQATQFSHQFTVETVEIPCASKPPFSRKGTATETSKAVPLRAVV
jgi:hypothetical protein